MILKTYECPNCEYQHDEMVEMHQSEVKYGCHGCGKIEPHFVVMNCTGMHYNFYSGWTSDRVQKNMKFEACGANLGSEDGPKCKDKHGNVFDEPYNNPEVRAERTAQFRHRRQVEKGQQKRFF